MQLLVSVADAPEARAALLGGSDVIDAKDPRGGALGAVRPELLRTLRDAVGTGRPLSAALGDRGPAALVERRAGAAAQVGAAFVKLGFRGAAAGLFAWCGGRPRGGAGATARAVGAGLVGVRGAACVGGRTGRVSRRRVAALSALARVASLAPAAALV